MTQYALYNPATHVAVPKEPTIDMVSELVNTVSMPWTDDVFPPGTDLDQAVGRIAYTAMLSALCAQMAAAVESYKHAMEGFAQAVRQDTGLAYPWPAQELSLPALEAALTAYRTLSPDPQWQRVPSKGDLIRLIGAEIWVESEDDRCKSEIRGLDDAASAILNRLDFSRQSARLRECNSENAEYAARILRCADELEQPVSSLTSASMTQASRFLRAFACDVANRARGEG